MADPAETTESQPPAADTPPAPPRKRRGFFGRLRLLLLWLALILLLAVQEPVFPHVVRALVKLEAWRIGVSVRIGKVEGTLFDPVVLRDSVWTSTGGAATTRIEVKRARAWLSWCDAFPAPVNGWLRSAAKSAGFDPAEPGGTWLDRLELDGVTAKVSFNDGSQPAAPAPAMQWLRASPGDGWLARPAGITIRHARLMIHRGEDLLWLRGAHLSLRRAGPGAIHAAQIGWEIQGASRWFDDIRGRATLDGTRATFSGLQIGPDLRAASLAADLAPARRRIEARFDAFGGRLTAFAAGSPEAGTLRIETGGEFENLRLDSLTRFLGGGKSAGIITRGSFSFRGTVRDPAQGEGRVTLDAASVQMAGAHLGAAKLDLAAREGRAEIRQCILQHDANRLELTGSLSLTGGGAEWWARHSALGISADLRDLATLSTLLPDALRTLAGQLFIRGSVNCTGPRDDAALAFGGQLIFSGSGIRWNGTPLEVFNAALVLHQRELQIIHAQFLNGDDYLRGVGRVSLAGDGAYGGVIRASVRDLSKYRAPFPFPPAGRLTAEWRGSGAGAAHEGKFTATLDDIAFATAPNPPTAPLRAAIEGAYADARVQLDKLEITRRDTSLTATATLVPGAVNLRGIRLSHGGAVRLEGDALLPLDLFSRWPAASAILTPENDTVSRVALTASGLDLREAASLSGLPQALAGTLNGTLTAAGPLKTLRVGGRLTLNDATIPLAGTASVSGVNAELTLADSTVTLVKATGRHQRGGFAAEGMLKLDDPFAPSLLVSGVGTNLGQPFSFRLDGPAAAPAVSTTGAAPFSATPPPARQN